MPEPTKPASPVSAGPNANPPQPAACSDSDRMICERCGQAEMFRMHAVWRCPACGFKTDCCGW